MCIDFFKNIFQILNNYKKMSPNQKDCKVYVSFYSCVEDDDVMHGCLGVFSTFEQAVLRTMEHHNYMFEQDTSSGSSDESSSTETKEDEPKLFVPTRKKHLKRQLLGDFQIVDFVKGESVEWWDENDEDPILRSVCFQIVDKPGPLPVFEETGEEEEEEQEEDLSTTVS